MTEQTPGEGAARASEPDAEAAALRRKLAQDCLAAALQDRSLAILLHDQREQARAAGARLLLPGSAAGAAAMWSSMVWWVGVAADAGVEQERVATALREVCAAVVAACFEDAAPATTAAIEAGLKALALAVEPEIEAELAGEGGDDAQG